MDIIKKILSFQLSLKAKEAIKVGLAYSITYLFILKFGWINGYWGAFVVGQIALFPNAQSLHNGALRLGSLIPSAIVATIIYAIAPQSRWLFIFMTSVMMMAATYMMIRDAKRAYFWNVVGFGTLVFLTTSNSTSAVIFTNIADRALGSALGIVVYTLIVVFLWPQTNLASLKSLSTKLTAVQAKIFSLMGSEDKKSLKQAIKQEIQLANGLQHAFFAKGSESYEVQEAAGYWNEFLLLSGQLAESFSRLNNSFSGLRTINIDKIIPELDEYRENINRRFEDAGDILQNGSRELKSEVLSLHIDEAYLKSLSPFEQLAFASSKQQFEDIAELSRKIVECANNIMDESVHKKEASPKKIQKSIYDRLTPDLDMLRSLFFIGTFTFIVYCIWIFFNPPGHMFWLYIPPTVAMGVAATPQMKTTMMVIPAFFLLTTFVLLFNIVVPMLSGVVEIGGVLFICMFMVFYFLEGVPRVMGVIALCSKFLLTNEQTYSFATSANMELTSLFTYISVFIYSYIVYSPRPQRAFLKQIRRYFKSARFLTSVMASDTENYEKRSMVMQFKIAFHRYELKTLPDKIKAWSAAINHKDFPENSPDVIDDLLINIHALSHSFEEWFASNNLHQITVILNETKIELTKWNRGIESVFQDYYNNLDSSLSKQLEDALTSHIKVLETIVNEKAERIKQLRLSATTQEKENLYRLIGSYQGLSLSIISYASAAEQINWKHWEEEVFA
ncbi:MAG: FUSC family protein [Deltaproteobacteria bacterium]|nr:FUSC family protein [Deltaproteobacteria bacterium]